MTSSPDNDASTPKPYLHGHHASVLRSHTSRTARNSCPHLLPHLRRGMRVLDVGCGPGTIMTDLAAIVAGPSPNSNDDDGSGGHVIGVDYSASVLAVARAHAERVGVDSTAISFRQADAYALPFADGTFDVVHANQVVQHVADPVRAVREMRRVARPDGGIVALREGDAQVWFCPEDDGEKGGPGKVLGEWYELWLRMARDAGLEPNAGRRLLSYALQAGFRPEEVSAGVGSECWGNKEELRELCGMRADKVVMSGFAERAVGGGYTTREGLERLSAAWRQFAELDGAWYAIMQGEAIITRSR
ncbi:Demethylmenaquinone methyltransferase [Lasiodiplodia hormozganensis]|uniref:Demethylmenaquinone methyltransferase n=1 Tax=Lasiodiplodia hormozganensis TaxID=869390 RepID=A0AA39Z203_9PEZI|nr:Demethylmenaquinone methyltransferase [Lasiodiplodia hormozganensis]